MPRQKNCRRRLGDKRSIRRQNVASTEDNSSPGDILSPVCKRLKHAYVFQMHENDLDARCPSTWTTFCRPCRPTQSRGEGRDLDREGEGHEHSRSRSATYATCPKRHSRCSCSRPHHFTFRHPPRPDTLSSLRPPSCDVTSALPVDFELDLLPGAARWPSSTSDVTDDVTDSRWTNHGAYNIDTDFNDLTEVTCPAEPEAFYSRSPTHPTSQYSLRRY